MIGSVVDFRALFAYIELCGTSFVLINGLTALSSPFLSRENNDKWLNRFDIFSLLAESTRLERLVICTLLMSVLKNLE